MAKNIVIEFLQDPMTHLDLPVTIPTTNTTTLVPASGAAVMCGNLPGVAESNVDSLTALTPVCTSCIAELLVNGIGPGGQNAAINGGDLIYMQTDGSLDKNSTRNGAMLFGTAFGNQFSSGNNTGIDTRTGQLVASGSTTTTIRVWVGKTVGGGLGPRSLSVARFLYNFAVDGGASCTPVQSDWIPSGAVVISGVVNSTTAVTAAGSATVAIGTTAGSSANSVLTATGKASLSLDAVVVATANATPFKMSAAGQLAITVATGPLTAGVIEGWVLYLPATNA